MSPRNAGETVKIKPESRIQLLDIWADHDDSLLEQHGDVDQNRFDAKFANYGLERALDVGLDVLVLAELEDLTRDSLARPGAAAGAGSEDRRTGTQGSTDVSSRAARGDQCGRRNLEQSRIPTVHALLRVPPPPPCAHPT